MAFGTTRKKFISISTKVLFIMLGNHSCLCDFGKERLLCFATLNFGAPVFRFSWKFWPVSGFQ